MKILIMLHLLFFIVWFFFLITRSKISLCPRYRVLIVGVFVASLLFPKLAVPMISNCRCSI